MAGLRSNATRCFQWRNFCGHRPEDHPRSQLHRSSYNQVLNYQIANNSALRQIFYWQPLTDFLRQLCGFDSFYRSDCPHLALSAKLAGLDVFGAISEFEQKVRGKPLNPTAWWS